MPVPFRPELDSLQTYVPPKSWRMAAEGRADEYAKLTSNELAFGPLPEAEAAPPPRPPGARADGRRGQGRRIREADLQRARLRAATGGRSRALGGASPRQPLPRQPRLPPQAGHSRREPLYRDRPRTCRHRVERGSG